MENRWGTGMLAKLKKLGTWLCWLLVIGLGTGVVGCTRNFFRKAADEEVEGILAEKDKIPLWKIEQYHVYPDARSRWADPSNPDHPPMPPDDQPTYAFSPHPQAPGKAGVGYVMGEAWLKMIDAWDQKNRTERKAAEEKEQKETEQEEGGTEATKEPPAVADKDKPASVVAQTPWDSPKNPVATYFDEPLLSKQPGYLLNLEQAVELGVINSPTYQTFREELYELVLPVTQQRFNFAYQWAATSDWIRQWAGKDASPSATVSSATSSTTVSGASGAGGSSSTSTPGSAGSTSGSSTTGGTSVTTAGSSGSSTSSSSTSSSSSITATPRGANNWTGQNSLSFSKLFVTGALLTFDFVNTSVWNFDPRGFTSVSTVSLNMTQPFLQGGGKAVTLEPLTQAERDLYYAIRSYARFREQFYVNIAQGNTLPASLAVAAGSGTGTNPISVLAALNIASTDVSGGFVSYLSTLFRECDEACDKKLVRDLERALRIYEGYQEGGQFSPLQVDQVRSTLLQARNTVLTDIQFVNNALDQFKLALGMPANLPLILDDTPARPITRQLDRYYTVITDSDAAYKLVEQQEDLPPEQLRAFLMRIYTRNPLVRGTEFKKKLPGWWKTWASATEREIQSRMSQLRKERRTMLDRKTEVEMKAQTLSEKETNELRESEIQADLGELELLLRRYESKPWLKQPKAELRRLEQVKLFRLVAYSAEIVLVWARNEVFLAVFKQWPELPKAPLGGQEDLDLSTAEVAKAQQAAVLSSLSNRWDLMNARAQLVDSWRQLRVTANALMGAFNVTGNLTSSTPNPGSHPFAFSTDRTAASLSLDAQLPLNRMAQRNAYRTALITYQQQRRSLTTLEDNIAVQVRFDVRQLQLFAANYRIQKRVLQSLYAQVESALEVITAPADPSALQASGTTGQANAAALTSQYLTALSSLNGAQTKMYDIWLSYLATRQQLYLDLESLRMDNRGIWLKEYGYDSDKAAQDGQSSPATLPAPAETGKTEAELPKPKPADE